jgi:hypothetical protein
MKTIVIISFSDLATDPRVNRQIRFLREKYRVIAAGWADPMVENVQFIPIKKTKSMFFNILISLQLLFRSYESWYWSQKHVKESLKELFNTPADLILANDIDTLPLALKLAKGTKVIFDAHEFAPRELEDLLFWRILFQRYKTYLCKVYIPQVNGMTTVCQGIADTYHKEIWVKPWVITNAPDYEDIQPHLLDKGDRKIRMIHHGAAGPSRKIENMIRMMDYLDGRYELNLMLIESWPGYLRRLKRLAKGKKNINFLPPVSMRALSQQLNQYDIGVFLLEPTNFNYFYALPNKFFEFIQARLAIAIGPSPEMARIVKEHDLGVVAEDFSPRALAHCLLELNWQKINYYKLQSHKIARLMSAEQNKKILLNLVNLILEG